MNVCVCVCVPASVFMVTHFNAHSVDVFMFLIVSENWTALTERPPKHHAPICANFSCQGSHPHRALKHQHWPASRFRITSTVLLLSMPSPGLLHEQTLLWNLRSLDSPPHHLNLSGQSHHCGSPYLQKLSTNRYSPCANPPKTLKSTLKRHFCVSVFVIYLFIGSHLKWA